MASLRDLQAGLAAELRGRTGALESEIVAGGLGVAGRLDVYRNNSRAQFDGALERTYPVLRRRVGDDYFRQLARGYREQHPSRSGDLHWIGRHFPGYLAGTLAGTGYEWLAELAALEWACETALVAAREPPVSIAAFAGLDAAAVAEARLRLQASLTCVRASTPVLDVWRANQPGEDGSPVDLSKGGQCVLVCCSEAGLVLRELDPLALEFTRALQGGAALGEAVDRAGLALEALPGALAVLFESGLVIAIAGPDTEHHA